MIDATRTSFWPVFQTVTPNSATGPRRKLRREPVFIHDAVTPWHEETVLLKILRAQAEPNEDQP